MLTLNTYLKVKIENKKIPSDLLKMCNEQHFSQTQINGIQREGYLSFVKELEKKPLFI